MTEKEFDCVEMKRNIQEQLLREVSELGEDEARRRSAERFSRDPILGKFLGDHSERRVRPVPIKR